MIHNLVDHSKDFPWLENIWFWLLLSLVEGLGLSDQKQEDSVSHSAEEGHSNNTQLVHLKDTQLVETNVALLSLVEGYEKMKDSIQRVKLSIGQTT